ISFASKAQHITLAKNNITIAELFKEIKRQSGYDFVYPYDLLSKGKAVNINVKNKPLREVLDESFKNQPFTYQMESNTVIVSPKATISKRSEEHTSELQSRENLVCRLLL